MIRAQEGVEHVNAARAKRAEEARKEGNTNATKTEIKRQNLDPIGYEPLNKSNKEIKRFVNLISRLDTDADQDSKSELYKRNYLKAAENEMGKRAARKIEDAIRGMTGQEVYDAVFADSLLHIDTLYFSEYYEQQMFLDRILARWERYGYDSNS